MKANGGQFFWCFLLVLFGVLVPSSHASFRGTVEGKCKIIVRSVLDTSPSKTKDSGLGKTDEVWSKIYSDVMNHIHTRSYEEMQLLVTMLNDAVKASSRKIFREEMQSLVPILNQARGTYTYIYRVRTAPTMGFEVVPAPVVFETVFKIHNTNHVKLVPKAGDKNFSISLVNVADAAFPAPSSSPEETLPDIIESVYHYKVTFTHNDVPAELSLSIPANSGGRQNLDELENMEFVLKNLPSIALKEVNSIAIFPASVGELKMYNTPAVAAFNPYIKTIILTAPEILHNPSRKTMLEIFQHEIGHAMAWAYYGSLEPDINWLKAALTDNKPVSLAGYDKREDFAEAMRAYLATEGGLQDPAQQRKVLFHRFKILDKILQVDTHPQGKVVLEQNMREIL